MLRLVSLGRVDTVARRLLDPDLTDCCGSRNANMLKLLAPRAKIIASQRRAQIVRE